MRNSYSLGANTHLAHQLSADSHEVSLDVFHLFEHSIQLLLRVMVECSETLENRRSIQASDARDANT